MEMYKQKFTRLQSEMFSLLCFKAGEKLNQSEMAKFLKVSPTAVAKALPLLEKEELATIEKHRNMNLTFVTLNRDSKKAVELKRVENLRSIYASGLADFLEENYPGCTVILFGSYARGEDTAKSDIDIAVIGTKGREVNLSEYEKKMGKEIRINFYVSFKDIHSHLKSNILSGITLSGVVRL